MATGNLSGFEKFCGGQFWDLSLTWNTDQPDFTPCFQNTLLAWVPCGFLLLLLPLYMYNLHTAIAPVVIPVSKLHTSRTVFGLLLMFLSLVNLVKGVADLANNADPPLVLIATPAIQAVCYVVAVVLMQIERRKGYVTSGVLFLFWFLSLLGGIVPFYSRILAAQRQGNTEDLFRSVTFYIWFALILIALVLSCFVDKRPPTHAFTSKKPCPEISASFISRITFWWITRLVYTGYKKDLEESDMWELHPRDISKNVGPVLQRAWQDELDKTHWNETFKPVPQNLPRQLSRTLSGNSHKDRDANEKTPLINGPGIDGEVTIADGKKGGKKKKVPTATLR